MAVFKLKLLALYENGEVEKIADADADEDDGEEGGVDVGGFGGEDE
jgi:hypothetical protein